MTESLVNDYQKWICDGHTVVLGLRSGIPLITLCDCSVANSEAEIQYDPPRSWVWSWESSRCIHAHTVLTHYHAQYAVEELSVRRIDNDD